MPLGRLRPAVMILVQIVDATLRQVKPGCCCSSAMLHRHRLAIRPSRSAVTWGQQTRSLYLFSRTPVWDCETILAIANRTIDDTRRKREADSCEAVTAAVAVMERDMIRFGETVCNNLDATAGREWLETNGIGGFASATITGCHTRRYHGLLVAATKPPVGRLVLLSKLEETLVVNGREFELGTNRYPGAVHPQGFRLLKQFRLDPFPTFLFE